MCGQKGCSIFWCFLYFLSGFALLGVGMWTPIDDRVFDSISARRPDLMDSKVPWRGWIGGLIALGAYSVLVGILGMAGSACGLEEKVKNSLIAFAVFASLGTIGALILGGIATAGFATTDRQGFTDDLQEALRDNYPDQTTQNDFIKAWNNYQIEFDCCGVFAYRDYQYTGLSNNTGDNVPRTCCVLNDNYDGSSYPTNDMVRNYATCNTEANWNTPPTTPAELNVVGCESKMWTNYRRWQKAVMAISWTTAGVQIIALIVSGCLKKNSD